MVAGIVFLVMSVLLDIVLLVPGMFLAFASDGCGQGCSIEVLSFGFYLSLIGPAVVTIVGGIFTIVAIVRAKGTSKPVIYGAITLGGSLGIFLLALLIVFGANGWLFGG